NGDDDHWLLASQVWRNADEILLADESSVPNVLLTIGGLWTPPAIPRNSTGAASSFKLITPL
ncbi:hypothetical protein HAX54_036030, partial [Datura stramonium]|nr:hypothetical protein [Datura stramonium]